MFPTAGIKTETRHPPSRRAGVKVGFSFMGGSWKAARGGQMGMTEGFECGCRYLKLTGRPREQGPDLQQSP